MAIEEARGLPASLLVYRESRMTPDYSLQGIPVRYLRAATDTGALTAFYRWVTLAYNPDRGRDATVDLDLILKATRATRQRTLYHDQFAGITGYLRKLLTGEDYAVYLHETVIGRAFGLKGKLEEKVDRLVLGSAKLVFTNSRRNQSVLDAQGLRAIVAYPGFVPAIGANVERKKVIVASTVWDANRRPELYVELARKTSAKVVLVGTWTDSAYMQLFKNRYSKLVEITGPLPEEAVTKIYQTSSVYVRFGFGERGPGQGGIQALGSGLPVITNGGLGICELITDGSNGFVVRSVEEAAERANEILNDEGVRRRMGKSALDTATSLSWRSHNDLIRSGLEQALG
jgi:glycosyltransferase involved in cell wall biosynthesis